MGWPVSQACIGYDTQRTFSETARRKAWIPCLWFLLTSRRLLLLRAFLHHVMTTRPWFALGSYLLAQGPRMSRRVDQRPFAVPSNLHYSVVLGLDVIALPWSCGLAQVTWSEAFRSNLRSFLSASWYDLGFCIPWSILKMACRFLNHIDSFENLKKITGFPVSCFSTHLKGRL